MPLKLKEDVTATLIVEVSSESSYVAVLNPQPSQEQTAAEELN
ncbi:50S ribosomal protein L9 [Chlamydia abortus]|nr:50S ribosomal protein L9 [Chlamydia abortus]